MRKFLYLLATCLLLPAACFAQTLVRYDNILLSARGLPIAGATVAVCTQPATVVATPCSPLAAIYSDNAGANQVNPITTDGFGRYHFYIAPTTCGIGVNGCTIQFYGGNVAPYSVPDQSFSGGAAAFIAGCTATNGVLYETAANQAGCGSLFTWDPVNLILQVMGSAVSITPTSVNAPHFVATNTAVSGYTDYPQGPTAVSDPICATANSICEQAPVSVTSYQVTKSGTSPSYNNSVKMYTAGSPTTETFYAGQVKQMLLTAYTNATASATNILSAAVDPSNSYIIHCHGIYKAAASGYFGLTITGPASPALFTYDFNLGTAISSAAVTWLEYVSTGTSYPSGVGETAVTTAATDMPWDLTIGLTTGTAGGTVVVQGLTVSTDTLTVEAGSYCTSQ